MESTQYEDINSYPKCILDSNDFQIPTCLIGHSLQENKKSENVCENCGDLLDLDISYKCKKCKTSKCISCYNKIKYLGVLKCEKEHDLIHTTIRPYKTGWICDPCDVQFLPHLPSWHCKECQYDMCIACYGEKIRSYGDKGRSFDNCKLMSEPFAELGKIRQIQELKQANNKLRNFNTDYTDIEIIKADMYPEILSKEYYKDSSDNNLLKNLFIQNKYKIVNGPTSNGFFDAFYLAWANHSNLILSPDDVWLAILHNIDIYINENEKKIKEYFCNT